MQRAAAWRGFMSALQRGASEKQTAELCGPPLSRASNRPRSSGFAFGAGVNLSAGRRRVKSHLPRWIAPLLWILAALDIVNGIEMFFFPSAWFFRLVPGVPETGPFNMHLVMDGGTFFIAVGVGLVAAALNPRRNAIAVVIAAVAGVMHSALHIWSHIAGLLSMEHLMTEVLGIYVPALALIAIAVILYSPSDESRAAPAQAA
jgi:hypothetical protein